MFIKSARRRRYDNDTMTISTGSQVREQGKLLQVSWNRARMQWNMVYKYKANCFPDKRRLLCFKMMQFLPVLAEFLIHSKRLHPLSDKLVSLQLLPALLNVSLSPALQEDWMWVKQRFLLLNEATGAEPPLLALLLFCANAPLALQRRAGERALCSGIYLFRPVQETSVRFSRGRRNTRMQILALWPAQRELSKQPVRTSSLSAVTPRVLLRLNQ